MEWNGLFHSILFRILHLEAILWLYLNPKTFNLGNPKLKVLGFSNCPFMRMAYRNSGNFCVENSRA